MSRPNIIHPNFQAGPGQINPSKRERAIMIRISQDAYDAILLRAETMGSYTAHEIVQRALEVYLGMESESASPSDSN